MVQLENAEKSHIALNGSASGGSTTPVASSFSATTGSLIALMLNYYAQHGSWRRSWLPYCYADLGLARRKIRAVGPGPPPAGTVSRQAPFQDPQTSTAVPG